MKTACTLIALLCMTTSSALAELATKKTLTIDDAKKVAAAAVAEAKKGAGTAAIAVVDDGGNLMLVERLDNTFAAGADISIGKARTAALFKKPTSAFENLINKGRTAMASLGPPDFTPLQGGVPIIVDGQIVGAIGVSGLRAHSRMKTSRPRVPRHCPADNPQPYRWSLRFASSTHPAS